MLDAIYILGTIAFFALMLAYVRACAGLGGPPSTNGNRQGAGNS